MRLVFTVADAPVTEGALALLLHEGEAAAGAAAAFDAASGGAVARAAAQPRFSAAKGKSVELVAPAGGVERALLVGAGPRDARSLVGVEEAAATAYKAVKATGATVLTLAFDLSAEEAAQAAFAVKLAAYRFDRYRTKEKPEAKPSVEEVRIAAADPAAAEAAFAALSAIADGVIFTRDLVSEPPNVLHPEEFARRCQALTALGLEVRVLGEAEMLELGFGSLLAVGHGSVRESHLVAMVWKGGGDPAAAPIAFVGKGVTFDTGGISLKPADGMEDMKYDMGGAGAVAGLMCALAGRKARVNAVGVLGLTENMPDGQAMRPGDVVTSLSGQTIEVINTDAEGRLVLADALWWTRETFQPRFMVDLATLTGAIVVSLGNDYAGLFSNDDALSDKLLAAGIAEGEPLWRMPLPAAYEKQIDSPIADMKNIGGRPGGSITAALFLQRFVEKTPWAHLDIAATAWRKDGRIATVPEGASGYGVRLLNRLVADNFED